MVSEMSLVASTGELCIGWLIILGPYRGVDMGVLLLRGDWLDPPLAVDKWDVLSRLSRGVCE